MLERLLVCMVSWFDGGSLAETLFTCLYLHETALARLRALNDAGVVATTHVVLLAAVTVVLKTVGLQRRVVIQADIYEVARARVWDPTAPPFRQG